MKECVHLLAEICVSQLYCMYLDFNMNLISAWSLVSAAELAVVSKKHLMDSNEL